MTPENVDAIRAVTAAERGDRTGSIKLTDETLGGRMQLVPIAAPVAE